SKVKRISGLIDAAHLAVLSGKFHLDAEQEGKQARSALQHAAANGEHARRHIHGHAAFVLGNLDADNAHDAFAEARHDFAFTLARVVDEFVDDKVGSGADGEGRA